jgi:hypothetical protein
MPHPYLHADEVERRRLRANEVRVCRMNVKADLAAGRVDLASILADPPPDLCGMQIGKLVKALPLMGVTRTHRILTRAGVSFDRRLDALTERQRDAILLQLSQVGRYSGRYAIAA